MDNQPGVFVKQCQSEHAARCEISGLQALSEAVNKLNITQLTIPNVISLKHSIIELKRIKTIRPNQYHWSNLATGLADLHNQKQDTYGWHQDNYIGLAPQKNELSDNWGQFFIQCRLNSQIEMIEDKSIRASFLEILKNSSKSLEIFLNSTTEFPSLLHGDLWSGNVLFSGNSEVHLIDPAVYWGDKESDIAMTELFGGFNSLFYETYNKHSPLCNEYPIKRTIYNLYHNLNHYNLFGDGYLSACKDGFSIIKSEFH